MHFRLFFFTFIVLAATLPAQASEPTAGITSEMEKIVSPIKKVEGWSNFISQHPNLFGDVSEKNPNSFLGVTDVTVRVGKDDYRVGIGCRSIWIAAPPKVVVQVVDDPSHFKSMYGLDKPANIFPKNPDGSFDAHIFKLVPGIETQDYVLNYSGHWEGDTWIQQAKLVKDEKSFALRNNVKIVQPSGNGSLFREISLMYPQRWWVRALHGVAQNIFKRELSKLNKSLKCAAERVQGGQPLTDDLGKLCYKESQN